MISMGYDRLGPLTSGVPWLEWVLVAPPRQHKPTAPAPAATAVTAYAHRDQKAP